MIAVDHRFALRRPALLSAPDKKPLVNAISPILACSALTLKAGAASALSDPNNPAVPEAGPFRA